MKQIVTHLGEIVFGLLENLNLERLLITSSLLELMLENVLPKASSRKSTRRFSEKVGK